MSKIGLSQEGLKLIACVTMLMDHIGATLMYSAYLDACMVNGVDMLGAAMSREAEILYGIYQMLRVIGRIAFPIYCFLLAEGVHYTRNPKKYALRLGIGALLSEIPFDLLFFGGITWAHSSVMVTLLIGFLYAEISKRTDKTVLKGLLAIPFVLAADLLGTDYGGTGVAMIALFVYSKDVPRCRLIQLIGTAVLCWLIGGADIYLGTIRVPMEMFAIFALIPIFCYSGQKSARSCWIQWAFYLFYPVHLTTLLMISVI